MENICVAFLSPGRQAQRQHIRGVSSRHASSEINDFLDLVNALMTMTVE
jgi:hypothetical protein